MAQQLDTPTSSTQIVLAEDSPTQAAWLVHVLKKHGYSVRHAPDGVAALELINTQIPHLLISDIMMPNMDGFGLCRAVKQDTKTAHVLVMLATSQTDPADVIQGLAAGADNFLNKPLDEDTIISRVRHMLAWQQIDSMTESGPTTVVDYGREWYEVACDARRSIHFLVSAIQETDKRNRMLETATREAGAALKRVSALEAGLRDLIENGAGAICVVGLDGQTLYTNAAAAELFGVLPSKMVSEPFPLDVAMTLSEVEIVRPDGSNRMCEMRISPTSWSGEDALLASFWDITRDVELRQELLSLSTTDDLTELLNRRGFTERAELAVTTMNRAPASEKGLALFFVDIDHMKRINDVHGHEAGDAALGELADILRAACRDSDAIGRIGGDEFVILLTDCSEHEQGVIKERILDAISRREGSGTSPFTLSVSIGIADMRPGSGLTLEELMAKADERMYREKLTRDARRSQ